MRWFILLVFLLPMASAEGVFVTDERTATTTLGTTSYAMTDEAPSGTDASKVYLATSLGALTYTTQFDYDVASDITGGEWTFTAFIACDVQSVVRPGVSGQLASARAILLKDGAAVTQVDTFELRTCDGPSDVWEAGFPLDATGTDYSAGSTLSVQLLVWAPSGPPGGAAQNFYTLAGSGEYAAGLTGPGLAGGLVELPEPELHWGEFNGTIAHDVQNHTMAYRFNATVEGNQSLELAVAPSGGSVQVQVLGNGTQLFNGTFQEEVNVTHELVGAGNWTIDIVYTDYTGRLSLALGPAVEAQPAAPGAPANETVEEALGAKDDQQSPLPAILVLAALMVAVRRRSSL